MTTTSRRTVRLQGMETGYVYRNLGPGRKRYQFATVIEAIQWHKHRSLRMSRSDGKLRDNRMGIIAEWVHQADADEACGLTNEEVIQWIFAPCILNSCSRATRGLGM